MRYIINSYDKDTAISSSVSIERSDEWQGFSTYIQPFYAEVSNASERLMVFYNTLRLMTPNQYDVVVERGDITASMWPHYNTTEAYQWFQERRATFGLGAVLVHIDSPRRLITIKVPHEAEVIEEDTNALAIGA